MRMVRTVLCVMILVLLSGCWDYNELNMQALVDGAGIDRDGENVSVSVMCGEDSVLYGEGKSFFDAVRSISSSSDKKLYWGHTSVLVFDENAARYGIGDVLDSVLRARDLYLDVSLSVVRGESARSLCGGTDVAKRISDTFANEANSRRFRRMSVWEILRERTFSGVYILPVAESVGDGISISGGAVMRNDKLAGFLSGEQMLFLSLLTHDGAGGNLPPIKHGDGFVSFEILGNDISEKLSGSVLSISQNIVLAPGEVSGKCTRDEMKRLADEYLTTSYEELLTYIGKMRFGDVFGASKLAGKRLSDVEVRIEKNIIINDVSGGGR